MTDANEAHSQSKWHKLPVRMVVYFLGLLLLSLGITLSVGAGMGVSSGSAFPYVLSHILPISLGSAVILAYCLLILLQWVLLGKSFRVSDCAQILVSTIFGFLVDFWVFLLDGFALPTYAGKIVQFLAFIVLVSLGIVLSVSAKLILMPVEGLSNAISIRFGVPFYKGKIIVDCTFVGLGAILSLIFLQRLEGIREGTVLSALLVGSVVKFFSAKLEPLLARLYDLPKVPSAKS